MENELLTSALALAVAGLVAFLLTPLTGRLAYRHGIIDHPSQDPRGHKQHDRAIPYLGGLALFGGLVAGSLFVFAAAEGIPVRHFAITIGAGLLLGFVGLADDIKPLPRSFRLIVQVGAAYAAWEFGFGVGTTDIAIVDLLLTVFWVVGITNAFNLLDNMDGLSAGLAGIAALGFAVMGVIEGLPVLPVVSAALAGACFGFWVHNRHPAKVFMGDAGSLFIGFLVALIGLRLRFDNLPEVTFLVPVVVLGMPILDTTLVVVSRMRHGRPVFLGGRDHISHRLVRIGLPTKTAVALMYFVSLCLAWVGLVISRSTPEVGFMLLGLVIVLGSFFGWLLLGVPIYEEEAPEIAELEEAQEEDKVSYLEEPSSTVRSRADR